MRMMLHVVIPVEAGNAAVREGKPGSTMQKILSDLNPEAVYFTDCDGNRSGYIFFDMKDSSEIPKIAEPWFLAFNATLTVRPAMTPQDLSGPAGAAMEQVAKGYPKTFGA